MSEFDETPVQVKTGKRRALSEIIFAEYASGGRMTVKQFKQMCYAKGYEGFEPMELDAAFVRLDKGETGYLEYEEFLEWWRLLERRHDELKYRSEAEAVQVKYAAQSFAAGTGGLGMMTPDQFRLKCYQNGYCLSDEELDEAFALLDKTGNGAVDFADYYRWRQHDDRFAHLEQHNDEYSEYIRHVAEYFREYDTDLKGFLSIEQFSDLYQSMVELGNVTASLEEVLSQIDTEGEGNVKLNDFVTWYSQACSEEYQNGGDNNEGA